MSDRREIVTVSMSDVRSAIAESVKWALTQADAGLRHRYYDLPVTAAKLGVKRIKSAGIVRRPIPERTP